MIYLNDIYKVAQEHFPDGTLHLKPHCLSINNHKANTITWLYESDAELFALISLVDWIRSTAYNRLIEFDGEQHYKDVGFFNTRTLDQTQEADSVKNAYALSHKINLVRIPYWERDKITLEMLLGDEYLIKQEDV